MSIDINYRFRNKPQRDFYYCTARNSTFSGGFNNGKTSIGCFKTQNLLFTFPGYRSVIARQKLTDLKKTTKQTFMQQCPSEMIKANNEQDGFTSFVNGSLIFWLHLDGVDANTLRGLETNSVLVDQAEEEDEAVYDVLDARIGRWSGYTIPDYLLNSVDDWPCNPADGKPLAPSYHMLLCNPDTQFHFIYRKYHPDSIDRDPDFAYFEGEWDFTLGSKEAYDQALKHDPEWVNKYVRGQWGASKSQIHFLRKESILEPSSDLIDKVLSKGNLFRSLDHGDSSPTCCLWVAAVGGVYIFYREYYVPNKVISYHRREITALSGSEEYSGNYADPSLAKVQNQKEGGFWNLKKEYMDSSIDAPPLYWQMADNNEFATRNRINELLIPSSRFKHPVTGESPAPGIYFIKKTVEYPNGCAEAIRQLTAQRKVLLGTIDGQSVYSDDRDENVPDHAYDPVRYFVAMHGTSPIAIAKKPPRHSFARYNKLLKLHQQMQRRRAW